MRPRTLVGALTFGVMVLAGAAMPGNAPSNGDFLEATDAACYYCSDAGLVGNFIHRFQPTGAVFRPEPNLRHEEWYDGTCGGYHYVCGGETEEELVWFQQAGGHELVERYVEAANWEGLRELMALVSRVKFNGLRSAVQVEDCDGHVVAHYPVVPEARGLLE